MRILSFVSFLLVGAAYGGPATQPACLTLETKVLCHFPFNYKGVIYDKCTYVETINNKPWCATVPEVNVTREGKLLFKSQVGDCDLESNCEVEGDKVGPAGCGIQNGKVREEGESWKHSDGCNTCFCSGGSPACTIALCGDEAVPAGCGIQNGKVREEGESWKHSDGCNTCFCSGGSSGCTKRLCAGCGIQNGKVREEGESWKHSDGCNTCFCSGGSPACTIALCGSRIQDRRVETISEADPKQISTNIPKMQPEPQVSSDDRRVSLGSFFECKFKKCGELCKTGVCDGDGFCVDPLESPCVQHSCWGKSCGEECLSGDIVGSCDIDGDCDFDNDRAINSCDTEVEDCSEDTLRGICSCPRHNKPVCAEDVYGHWQSVVYANLCLYECAKKKAACKNKRGFPELVECNF